MFLATTTANSGVMSTGMLIMWLVIMFGMMYFLMIRPQKKNAWHGRCFRQKSAKAAAWHMKCWNIVWRKIG